MKEAMLYERLPGDKVRCNLCAHRCVIDDGEMGRCCVRQNQGGTLSTLVYGRVIAQCVDPVEKQALFHFAPGSFAYSVGTPGCNFRCQWCQNWQISQVSCEQYLPLGQEATPQQIVAAAQEANCSSIAYAYTEPTVFFEYAYDTARLARESGLANIYVTNGFMTEEMLEAIHPYLDAANVDLKTFGDETYRRYIGARLQPVLDTLQVMKRLGIWLEVTTLVVPGINDDPGELENVARFVVEVLGAETPWHISRFFPAYRMHSAPPTPVETLRRAKEIGLAQGLKYVYVGNAPDAADQDTVCPACGKTLIQRHGFMVLSNRTRDGRCPECRSPIAGVNMGTSG
jgi:pyruvate formate lyase activating enzyme